MDEPRQFVCKDCEMLVFSFMPPYDNDQDLCAECSFLRTLDPAEREKLRRLLRFPVVIKNDNQ